MIDIKRILDPCQGLHLYSGMFFTNLTHLVNNISRQARVPGAQMHPQGSPLFGRRPWSADDHAGNDLEESVANWLARQEPTSWIGPAIMLSMTLAAIVLFAVSR